MKYKDGIPHRISLSSCLLLLYPTPHPHLFGLLALFSKSVTSSLPQEADGNVVHLLLVEHSESVRLAAALS